MSVIGEILEVLRDRHCWRWRFCGRDLRNQQQLAVARSLTQIGALDPTGVGGTVTICAAKR